MFQADVCLKALRKEGTSWNWQLELVHAPVTAAAAADRLGSQRGAFSHLPEVTALLSGRVLHPGVAFKPMTLTITNLPSQIQRELKPVVEHSVATDGQSP